MLDVDYHHGNGTQEIFYERDDVQYVSLHGDPAAGLPVHRRLRRRDRRRSGSRCNCNIPLAARTADDEYVALLGDRVADRDRRASVRRC